MMLSLVTYLLGSKVFKQLGLIRFVTWSRGYKTWVHSQTQNKAQWLAAFGCLICRIFFIYFFFFKINFLKIILQEYLLSVRQFAKYAKCTCITTETTLPIQHSNNEQLSALFSLDSGTPSKSVRFLVYHCKSSLVSSILIYTEQNF